MLFRKILSSCAGTAGLMGKIILLFLFCAFVGLCVVYPLWKFAVTLPSAYTFFVCAFFVLCALVLITSKIKTYLNECGADTIEMKKRVRSLFVGVTKIVLIAGGLFFFVMLLYNGSRATALAVLALTFVLYGILSFGSKKI